MFGGARIIKKQKNPTEGCDVRKMSLAVPDFDDGGGARSQRVQVACKSWDRQDETKQILC